MARFLVLVWGFCLVPLGAATADGPAEVPPTDFVARQYIDSAGCVYLRAAGGWQARRDLDGQPICGYPPSVLAATVGIDPATDPALAMPGMQIAEARLLAALTGEMQPGEFVGAARTDDRAARVGDLDEGPAATAADLGHPAGSLRPAARTPDAPPRGDPDFTAGADLAAAVAVAPAIAASGAADLHPDSHLCSLIGAAPRGVAADGPGLGGDVSQGYCTDKLIAAAGALTGVPVAGVPVAGVPVAGVPVTGERPADPIRGSRGHSATSPDITAHRRAAATRPAVQHRSASTHGARGGPTAGRAAPRATTSGEAMIPAGARWLEVGRYTDPLAADSAAARLAEAGFTVGRMADRADQVAIMAGPFSTRQAIVAAHDRLVRGGWRGVRAR